jgi:hypothetical protein
MRRTITEDFYVDGYAIELKKKQIDQNFNSGQTTLD